MLEKFKYMIKDVQDIAIPEIMKVQILKQSLEYINSILNLQSETDISVVLTVTDHYATLPQDCIQIRSINAPYNLEKVSNRVYIPGTDSTITLRYYPVPVIKTTPTVVYPLLTPELEDIVVYYACHLSEDYIQDLNVTSESATLGQESYSKSYNPKKESYLKRMGKLLSNLDSSFGYDGAEIYSVRSFIL